MDPKATSALDPKLKEVYDRVMGTGTGGKTPPPTNPVSSQPPPSVPQAPTTPVAPQSAPVMPTSPTPTNPAPTTPQPVNSTQPQAANKSAIDYASLAAKYATPLPSMTPQETAPRAAAVKPSTTAYGVVNNGAATKPAGTPEKKASGGMKKILLFVGIPVFLIIYSIIWIVVFGVDITAFLPI